MTEDQIKAREVEIRKEFPASFSHPELKAGEMSAGERVIDDAVMTVLRLRHQRLHARHSTGRIRWINAFVDGKPEKIALDYCHVFVNIREQILAEANAPRTPR